MERYQNLWLTASLPNVYPIYVMFSSKAVFQQCTLYTLQRKISFILFTQFLKSCTFDPLSLRKHVVMPQLVTLRNDAWGTTAEIQYWQGCTLPEPNGPWCLIFAPWQLENLSFLKKNIMLGTLDFTVSEHWNPFLEHSPGADMFHYPDLVNASDNCSQIISLIAQLFKSTTKTWVVHIISKEFLQSFQRRHFGGKPVTASQIYF